MTQRYLIYQSIKSDRTILEDMQEDKFFILHNNEWKPLTKREGEHLADAIDNEIEEEQ